MATSRKVLLTPDEARTRVLEVYADLEKRPVERACTRLSECCQFKLTGSVPYLTEGEAQVCAQAMRAKGIHRLAQPQDGACPLLDPKTRLCQIYENRPFGCRTHFCEAAGGEYKRREVVDLIHRLEDIDTALGGNGPRTLPVALKEALAQGERRGGVFAKAAPRARGRG